MCMYMSCTAVTLCHYVCIQGLVEGQEEHCLVRARRTLVPLSTGSPTKILELCMLWLCCRGHDLHSDTEMLLPQP